METLVKFFLSAVAGLIAYAVFSVIPILKFVSLAFGVLVFLAVGTYLMSRN